MNDFERKKHEREVLLSWYLIRDTMFGQNHLRQDFSKALVLASNCVYPEAIWLTKVFSGRSFSTTQAAVVVLREKGEDEARALCFAALLVFRDILEEDHSDRWLRRSAELGYPFAQAELARRVASTEKLMLAQKAALEGERDGFYQLALVYIQGRGCEKDCELAKENALIAAKLDHIDAMCLYGDLLEVSDPGKWTWLAKAAELGSSNRLMVGALDQVRKFRSGKSRPPIIFAIGRVLKGNINADKKEIFGSGDNFELFVGPAYQAIDFFIVQSFAARRAVDTWTRVGLCFKIVKDIRILIGKIIWEARSEAEYETEPTK